MDLSLEKAEVDSSNIFYTRRRIHISHLDGLRGLAALYVVIFHAYVSNELPKHGKELPFSLYHLLGLISFGQAAVAVFIVLSGYCLMMPLVRADAVYIRGGIINYIKRRAWRILPPYYSAGVISLLLIRTVPGMRQLNNNGWDASLPAFPPDILASHFFLIHNLNSSWAHKVDYPMWSVATEWQIYFLFPLLLLPVWRRFSILATVVVAFGIGIAPHWLFHGQLDSASFEFIGLFAFGMAGAIISFSEKGKYSNVRMQVPWGFLSLLLLIPMAFFAKFRGNGDWPHTVLTNLIVGLATTCLLIYCAKSLFVKKSKSVSLVLTILQSRPCVALGSFSYSLYLIHAPTLAVLAIGAKYFQFSSVSGVAISLLIGVPLSISVAYLFFLAFEKPFLVKRNRETPAEVALDAALSPAP